MINEKFLSLDKQGFLSENINKYSKNIKDDFSDVLDLTCDINKFGYELYNKINLKNLDIIGVYNALFYSKIHKTYQAVILLLEKGLEDEANALGRVILENLFVMQAINNDSENFNKLIENDYFEKNNILKNIKEPNRLKYLKKSVIDIEVLEKAKKTSTKRWAELAGMEELYTTVYKMFSYNVHIDLNTMEKNINKKYDGNTDGINIAPKCNDIYLTLCTISDFLLRTIKIMIDYFQIDEKDKIDRYEMKIEFIYKEKCK